ncbi:hypothetical protein GGR57DRAFT_478651 [Xylariaceae sp. FL1272]|nr:hypothetical protein GGR57DRAFT_478651 [Xylariaceae sp. FL1272]
MRPTFNPMRRTTNHTFSLPHNPVISNIRQVEGYRKTKQLFRKVNDMKRVFPIPELLESILLHLDQKTLLLSALRVCKTWHTLINTSTPIQQILYSQAFPNPWNPNIGNE